MFSLLKKLIWLCLTLFILGCFAVILLVIHIESQLPDVSSLKDIQLEVPLSIYTADGKLIAQFGPRRRDPVTLNQIPKEVIDATLATEDQRYFYHSGVDVLGLLRASVVLLLTGKKEQGGSTITMQVARNYFLSIARTALKPRLMSTTENPSTDSHWLKRQCWPDYLKHLLI